MNKINKSLIDNWSLEQAGSLLDNKDYHPTLSNEVFIKSLGGLSNYINSLLLYDQTSYLANGFECDWARFKWFERNVNVNIDPIDINSFEIDWNSEESFIDSGMRNYLITSKHLESDLFISTQRADKIIQKGLPRIETSLSKTLDIIDDKVKKEKEEL